MTVHSAFRIPNSAFYFSGTGARASPVAPFAGAWRQLSRRLSVRSFHDPFAFENGAGLKVTALERVIGFHHERVFQALL